MSEETAKTSETAGTEEGSEESKEFESTVDAGSAIADALKGIEGDEDEDKEEDGDKEQSDDDDGEGDEDEKKEDEEDGEDEGEESKEGETDEDGDGDGDEVIKLTDDVSVTKQEVIQAVHAATNYTQKTQALAEERREVSKLKETMESVTAAVILNSQPEFEKYEKVSKAQWDAMLAKDPKSYQAHQARFAELKDSRGKILDNVKVIQEELQRRQGEEIKKRNEESLEILQSLEPEFDENRYKAVMKYAETQGIKPEVFKELSDPYLLHLLSKSERMDKVSKDKPKAKTTKKANPTLKATRGKTGTPSKLKQNMEYLRKHGGNADMASKTIAQALKQFKI